MFDVKAALAQSTTTAPDSSVVENQLSSVSKIDTKVDPTYQPFILAGFGHRHVLKTKGFDINSIVYIR